MSSKGKPGKRKGVVRGRSVAFLITVGLHAALLIGAVFYTAMVVLQREEPKFEGTKIARPKMELKKLQVPVKVKKIRQPKFNMAAPPKAPQMNLNMPALGRIGGGIDALSGGGLGNLGFSMNFDTLFGGDAGTGNELVGTFYDLTKKSNGMPSMMTRTKCISVLQEFIDDGWDEDVLNEYTQAPDKKFTVALMMQPEPATLAREVFNVPGGTGEDFWVVHYKGQITAPETGRYRFCGVGNDFLVVRVGRDIVLDASWHPHKLKNTKDKTLDKQGLLGGWKSRDENDNKYPLSRGCMTIGDWMSLRKGKPVEIDILIGDMAINLGQFYSQLLIEQEGKEYKQVQYAAGGIEYDEFKWDAGTRPILPVFKMAPIPDSLAEKMKINSNEVTLEGPTFGSLPR